MTKPKRHIIPDDELPETTNDEKIRKLRLTAADRNLLLAFAKNNINDPERDKNVDALYREAFKIVLSVMRKRYPEKDMDILGKYGLASKAHTFNLRLEDGSVIQFECLNPVGYKDKDYISVPQGRSMGINILDQQQGEKIEAYQAAANERREYMVKKEAMYKALIYGVARYGEILEVWPAAEVLKTDILSGHQALSLMSPDVIAAIRADNAGARK